MNSTNATPTPARPEPTASRTAVGIGSSELVLLRGFGRLTLVQLGFLDAIWVGPAQWYHNHKEARALTRRGLARYERRCFAWKFVITEKGRDAWRAADRANLITSARKAADAYDAALQNIRHEPRPTE